MERGECPWRRTWAAKPATSVHGHVYRGVNAFLLSLSGYESHVWMTYQQARERGGFVRKGETGTPVLLFRAPKVEESESGLVRDKKRGCFATTFTVFNFEQTEGVYLPEKFAQRGGERDARAEDVVRSYLENGPELIHQGDVAGYSPSADTVYMPAFSAFESPAAYYAALFHELTHSTGHPSRLDREGISSFDGFGSHRYAKEELVAEIGAALLCGLTGTENTASIENAGAYLRHWALRFREDPSILVSAASAAQKAVDRITGAAVAAEGQAAA